MPFYKGATAPTHHLQGPRKPGTLVKTGHLFAQAILDDPFYRESLIRRIKNDTLPPAIEALMWFYAFGKPKPAETYNRIEENAVNNPDLSQIQKDELILRARALVAQIENLGDRHFKAGNPSNLNVGDSGSVKEFVEEIEENRPEIDITPQPKLLEFPKGEE